MKYASYEEMHASLLAQLAAANARIEAGCIERGVQYERAAVSKP